MKMTPKPDRYFLSISLDLTSGRPVTKKLNSFFNVESEGKYLPLILVIKQKLIQVDFELIVTIVKINKVLC